MDAFRTHTLQQSLHRPFNGETIIRLLNSVIPILRSSFKEKPAPCDSIVNTIVGHLVHYGTFRYPDFKWDRHDAVRMDTFKDECVKQGRLTRGRWTKKVFITRTVMSRMVRSWLVHHHKRGCKDWDAVIHKALTITLISALGCRSGDVNVSRGWTADHCLKYSDICLEFTTTMFEEDDTKLQIPNLLATITLRYVKGSKDRLNEDFVIYFNPLDDPAQMHACPIHLLFAHALRHDLVIGGPTIEGVLRHAANNPTGLVTWRRPELPVLCALTNSVSQPLALETPAAQSSANGIIKSMGLVSNILSRVHIHATRNGFAKDVAHLPQTSGQGATTDSVRQALGHDIGSIKTTEGYIGGSTRQVFNEVAKEQSVRRGEAKFSSQSAVDFVNRPVSKEELAGYFEEKEPGLAVHDRKSHTAVYRAQRRIREQRKIEFRETAQPDHRGHTAEPLEQSDLEIFSTFIQKMTRVENKGNSDGRQDIIDLDLLNDEADASFQTDPSEMATLRGAVFFQDSLDPDLIDALEEQIVAGTSNPDDQVVAPVDSSSFITAYSKVNIVKHDRFATTWKSYLAGRPFETTIGPYCCVGGSRDAPTPYVFKCEETEGCTYTTLRHEAILNHEKSCNEQIVAAANCDKPFACNTCSQSFGTEVQRKNHVRKQHDFKAKPCEYGCDPEKKYETDAAYRFHIGQKHGGPGYPVKCTAPDCSKPDEEFTGPTPLSRHLKNFHNLEDITVRARYMPPKFKLMWNQDAKCPIEGCVSPEKTWDKVSSLKTHLKGQHYKTASEADDLTADLYNKQIVPPRVSKKRKAAVMEADDDDDVDNDA